MLQYSRNEEEEDGDGEDGSTCHVRKEHNQDKQVEWHAEEVVNC